MSIPSVTLTTVDPGLPKSLPGTVTLLVVGVATTGTLNTVQAFGSEKAVLDAYTSGQLAEALIDALRKGGSPVYGCRLTGSIAAANSAVTSAGTTPPVVTIAGSAADYFDLRIEITTAGTLGTSRFRYSLDGGITYSQIRATAASHLMAGTGITITFPAGTYAADNVYTATCAPALLNATDITALQTAVLASPRLWDLLLLAGRGGTAAQQATVWASLSTLFDALQTAKRYRPQAWIMSSGTDVVATTQTAFAAVTDSRGHLFHGFRYCPSFVSFEGRGFASKSGAVDLAAWQSGQLISTDAARTSEALTGTLLDSAGAPRITHDEYQLQNMDDLGFCTYRTWPDRQGVFFTNARTKSSFGSDFTFLTRRLVFNRARSVAYSALVDWIGKNVRTNPNDVPNPGNTGTIAEVDAVRVDAYVNDRLTASIMRERNADGFAGHATAVAYRTDRTFDTLASDGLQGAVEIVPLTAVKTITSTIGFVRQLGA